MRIVEGNVPGFDNDAQIHFNRLTGAHNAQLRIDINALIHGLKIDDIWDKIDILCVVHPDEADSLLNLKGNGSDADSTKVGSPTFTADRGFLMVNSGSNYIDVGETPLSLTKYAQYDGHLMAYRRTTIASTNLMFLKVDSNSYLHSTSANTTAIIIQQLSAGSVSGTIGFAAGSVTAINARNDRLNDSAASNSTSQAHTVPGASINVGYDFQFTSAGCGMEISAWGFGSGLSAVELGNYEDRIRTYMQARGADVY